MMAKKIGLDAGHGINSYPPNKGVPKMAEFSFNSAVVGYAKELLEINGFSVLLTQPLKGNDVPLDSRTNLAIKEKVDLLISVHADANANTGARGHWGFYWDTSSTSKRLADIYSKHMTNVTGTKHRGNHASKLNSWTNFHMTRIPATNVTYKFPAVLYEHGFMTNAEDLNLLLSTAYRKKCAEAIARTVCEYFGVTFKLTKPVVTATPVTPVATQLYRVRLTWADAKSQKGAYASLQSSKDLADSLQKEGAYKVFDESGKIVYSPKLIPIPVVLVTYRVRKTWVDVASQIGAYTNLQSAKDLADSRAKENYKVFNEVGKIVYTPIVETPTPTPISTPIITTYRVRKTWVDVASQIGAFTSFQSAKDLADSRAKENYKVFDNSGKIVYASKVETPIVTPTPIVVPTPIVIDEHKGHHDINGKSLIIDENKMLAFVEATWSKINKKGDSNSVKKIAKAFISIGNKYNIRGDIAFCQSLIETGWFLFDGGTAVTPDQHNYCGLGVTSKGMKGHSFATIEEGVLAQIQHLFAYANKNEVPKGEVIIDPRFKYVTRGIAPHWEDLSNRWAMNANYGTHILSIFKQLEVFKYTPKVEILEPVQPVQTIITPIVNEEIEEVVENKEPVGKWVEIINYFFEKLADFFGRK